MYIRTSYPFLCQLAELFGTSVKGNQLMVLGRVVFAVVTGFWLDMRQDSGMDDRRAEKSADQGISSDLFFQGNEVSCFLNIATVSLGHIHVIAVLEKAESDPTGIGQFPQ